MRGAEGASAPPDRMACTSGQSLFVQEMFTQGPHAALGTCVQSRQTNTELSGAGDIPGKPVKLVGWAWGGRQDGGHPGGGSLQPENGHLQRPGLTEQVQRPEARRLEDQQDP